VFGKRVFVSRLQEFLAICSPEQNMQGTVYWTRLCCRSRAPCGETERAKFAGIVWERDSRDILKDFPEQVGQNPVIEQRQF
jgi:hypothetical protein